MSSDIRPIKSGRSFRRYNADPNWVIEARWVWPLGTTPRASSWWPGASLVTPRKAAANGGSFVNEYGETCEVRARRILTDKKTGMEVRPITSLEEHVQYEKAYPDWLIEIDSNWPGHPVDVGSGWIRDIGGLASRTAAAQGGEGHSDPHAGYKWRVRARRIT